MTQEEVGQILYLMDCTFSDFHRDHKNDDDQTSQSIVNSWTFMLGDYAALDVMNAIKLFVATKGSAFAPSISQIIEMIHKPQELSQMSDADAWAIVRKAISRGNYYSEKDFETFPEPIKRAVGSPSQLRIWAQDEDFNDGVESSNFYKRYRTEIEREKTISWMPQEARAKLSELQQGLLGMKDGN